MSEIGYHPNYDKYVEMIVAHPNYKGLYYDRDKDGKVNWVVTGKSPKGQLRQAWWNETCKKLGVQIQKGCYAKVARMIHPTGIHVCQCCGEERSIFYEYPTLRILKKLNDEFGLELSQTDYTIREFIREFCKTQAQLNKISRMFKLPMARNTEDLISIVKSELIDKESALFSPGVMCNPPDRYNGFHSYALCCRKLKDTGFPASKMVIYDSDKCAYEAWADGDWNKANVLMSALRNAPKMICPKCNSKTKKSMSADHVGPISLGFCHNLQFAPMCKSCNSAKNNRLYKSDVDTLLQLEALNIQVVSWHSKYVWDRLKNTIDDDDDAFRLSKVMNACHKNVLYLFYLIYSATGKDFLMRYLHPEYAMFNHRVTKLNLNDLSKSTFSSSPTDSKNKQNLRERYIRVAFNSLESVGKKKNRKIKIIIDKDNPYVINIITLINEQKYKEAELQVNQMVNKIADSIINSIPN